MDKKMIAEFAGSFGDALSSEEKDALVERIEIWERHKQSSPSADEKSILSKYIDISWYDDLEIGQMILAMKEYASQYQRQQGTEWEWEKDLAEDAINAYFHEAIRNLERKDLGDIERRNWEGVKTKCKKWFEKYRI